MASRTSTQKKQSNNAAQNFEDGIVHFRVLSAKLEIDDIHGGTSYFVAVPKALMCNGLLPKPCGTAVCGTWGKNTEFGDDIYRVFRDMKGVELYLENDTPHMLVVFVRHDVIKEMAKSYLFATRGLPAPICIAIEEVILRNNTLGQRFAEWLRRLF
jgi:hypothetical protein